jgi:type IV pilus biogenesis protein CpaD/CtpE
MKRDWTQDELIERWTLAPSELVLLMNKSGPGRLGFAALLKFFQAEARFPTTKDNVPVAAVEYLAAQTKAAASAWTEYDWHGRAIKYHRAEIRTLWGFREATAEDGEDVSMWLMKPCSRRSGILSEYWRRRLEGYASSRSNRLQRTVWNGSSVRHCAALRTTSARRLSAQLSASRRRSGLMRLLELPSPESVRVPLHELRADPGPASIETLEEELAKLSLLRDLQLATGSLRRACPFGSSKAIAGVWRSKRSLNCGGIRSRSE